MTYFETKHSLDPELIDLQHAAIDLDEIDWEDFEEEQSEAALEDMRQAIRSLSNTELILKRREFHRLLVDLESDRLITFHLPYSDPIMKIIALRQLEKWMDMVASEAIFRVQDVDTLKLPHDKIIPNPNPSGNKATMTLG